MASANFELVDRVNNTVYVFSDFEKMSAAIAASNGDTSSIGSIEGIESRTLLPGD